MMKIFGSKAVWWAAKTTSSKSAHRSCAEPQFLSPMSTRIIDSSALPALAGRAFEAARDGGASDTETASVASTSRTDRSKKRRRRRARRANSVVSETDDEGTVGGLDFCRCLDSTHSVSCRGSTVSRAHSLPSL